ncbi:MAG: SGNH/GDSL hydrolase family protein [Reyranella sp.]|uniref:SGNH/GDSL hydrolase family protein n=1 Tax=Reyranella sp. TaxID=1929291 RepID=UPI00121D4C33|nr:GDSL-type esterase/lipase family protein [Reyranella sp.]TAJ96111.1 MAG: SGNH/GDSL hydrolase family protein [Reyranella sp.]
MSKFLRFISLLGILAVAGTATWLFRIDELKPAGPRADYFLYLAALLAVAVLTVRWPRFSGTLLVLACVEFAWGLGSWALAPPGSPSLLPPVVAEPARFLWHPLLQAVPVPGLAFTSATGLAIRHSSEGTRGRDPDPARLADSGVVATFGGSAAYDIGNGEGDTWPDRLDEALREDRLVVVNHGVPGYTTAEHLLQTAFYPEKFGKAPRCAVYFVGWNDLRNAHIPNLDAGYADFHMPSQVDSLKVRRIGGSNVTISPLLTVLARLVAAEVDTVRYGKDPYALPPASGSDPAQSAIFERNVRTISAINRLRGTPTIWVGQVVNRDRLKGEGLYGWLPRVRDRDLPQLLQQSNAALERTARALGDTYVALSPEAFGPADFVDEGHFSAAGARRFAALLAPVVRETCR